MVWFRVVVEFSDIYGIDHDKPRDQWHRFVFKTCETKQQAQEWLQIAQEDDEYGQESFDDIGYDHFIENVTDVAFVDREFGEYDQDDEKTGNISTSPEPVLHLMPPR